MLVRLLLVGLVWMIGGFTLMLFATSADNPLPYNVALGSLFIVLVTLGNYWGFYGFGASEEQRRPNGRVPLLRKFYFWMAGLMFIMLSINLPIQIRLFGGFHDTSINWPAWLALAVSCASFALAGFLTLRWSRHALVLAITGSAGLATTGFLAYGWEPMLRMFPTDDTLPLVFLSGSTIPFLLILVGGRIGGDLR